MIFLMLMHGLLFGKICNPETEEYDGTVSYSLQTVRARGRLGHHGPWYSPRG